MCCARKETVDTDTVVTSRNGDRKIMQFIRITSRPPSRKRKWNLLGQYGHFSTFTPKNGKSYNLTPVTHFNGILSRLRQLLATESPLKMIKNAFYFISKALFLLKIFKFLSRHFGQVAKRLDKKDKSNFKFYDVTAWLTNNCITHIVQYVDK